MPTAPGTRHPYWNRGGLFSAVLAAFVAFPAVVAGSAAHAANDDDQVFNQAQETLTELESRLLEQAGYKPEPDGTLRSPDTSKPVGSTELFYVLEDLRSRQRLRALLEIRIIYTRYPAGAGMSNDDQKTLRRIARENWPLFNYKTRGELSGFFSGKEKEELDALLPKRRSSIQPGEHPVSVALIPESVPIPKDVPLQTLAGPLMPLGIQAGASGLPDPPPPPEPVKPAPAAQGTPNAPIPELDVEQAPLPSDEELAEAALQALAPQEAAPLSAPAEGPPAPAAAQAPGETAPSPAPGADPPLEALAPPAVPSPPLPVPAPATIPVGTEPEAARPEFLAETADPPPAPVQVSRPVEPASQASRYPEFDADAFQGFLETAPYGREIRPLLKLIAEHAPETERRIALGALREKLPHIVADSVQAGDCSHSGWSPVDGPGDRTRIALNDGAVLLRQKSVFSKGRAFLLPDSPESYAKLGMKPPSGLAFSREAASEKESSGDWGRTRLYKDGGMRLRRSAESMAASLFSELLLLDARERGWGEGFYVRLWAEAAGFRFLQAYEKGSGRSPVLERDFQASFLEWLERPEDHFDFMLQTLNPDTGAAAVLAEAGLSQGNAPPAAQGSVALKVPEPASAAAEAWLEAEIAVRRAR